jgi:hypothetical protein
MLDGDYPLNTDSRLVSSAIQLPLFVGFETIRLSFYHTFSFASGDTGLVEISFYDEISSKWSEWFIIDQFQGTSGGWTRANIPLNDYNGLRIKISFLHTSDRYSPTSAGWYIDNIRLPGKFLTPCEGDFDNDGDVDGSDLSKFASKFGSVDCSFYVEGGFCWGDFNGDADVDGSDLAIFAVDFGRTDCFNE